jgi:hypothetical protein
MVIIVRFNVGGAWMGIEWLHGSGGLNALAMAPHVAFIGNC